MRAVLDVGQFVSASIQPNGHPGQIVQAAQNKVFDLLISPPIVADLQRVLRYPRIRKRHRLDDQAIDAFVAAIARSATLTPGLMQVQAVTQDPDDDIILACAVEGQADVIVASDRHLADLGSYGGIAILTPRAFLDSLPPQASPTP